MVAISNGNTASNVAIYGYSIAIGGNYTHFRKQEAIWSHNYYMRKSRHKLWQIKKSC